MSFEKIPFMSVKMRDLRIDQIEKLSSRYALCPHFQAKILIKLPDPIMKK